MWVFTRKKIIISSIITFFVVSTPILIHVNNKYINSNQNAAKLINTTKVVSITTWNTDRLVYDKNFESMFSSAYDNDRKVKEYVSNHLSRFVANLPNEFDNVKDVVITRTRVSHEAGTVSFTIGLKKYTNENGLQENNGNIFIADFTLTGFKTINNPNNLPTMLKVKFLSCDDMLYKNVFPNDKGFQVDWSKEFTYRAEALMNYMNNPTNLNDFFLFPSSTRVKTVNIFSTSDPKKLRVEVNFSGKVNGNSVPNIQGDFFIVDLKPIPNFSKNGDLWKILNDKANVLTKQFQGELIQNKVRILEEIKIEVANFLNKNEQNIPNKALPPTSFFAFNQIFGDISFDQNNNIIGNGFYVENNGIRIELANGNFNKFSKFRDVVPEWVGYLIIIGGSLGLILLFVLVIRFIIKQKKKYSRFSNSIEQN